MVWVKKEQNTQEYTDIVIKAQRPQGKPKKVLQYIAERYCPDLGSKLAKTW